MIKEVKFWVVALLIIVASSLVLNTCERHTDGNPRVAKTISVVQSKAVSGHVTTEVEVDKDGSVKVHTNEVTLTAKRDIKQGEEFKVDLGVHTISTPVQFSDTTAFLGAYNDGLAVGLSINETLIGSFTYGLFFNTIITGDRTGSHRLGLGVNLGYYWDINKQIFVGYDIINEGAIIGLGVRW